MTEFVVRLTRAWLGTPYSHRASRKGAGCDCLGLVRGVWRELHGNELEEPPFYASGWIESNIEELLWQAMRRHLVELPRPADLAAGQVLLFRMRDRLAARHLGILTLSEPDGQARFVHAYERHGVVESPLSSPWRRRIVARFVFD